MATRTVIYEDETQHPNEVLERSHMQTVICLLAMGHKPYRIEAEGRLLIYIFDKKLVQDDINRFDNNQEFSITRARFSTANELWNHFLSVSKMKNTGA